MGAKRSTSSKTRPRAAKHPKGSLPSNLAMLMAALGAMIGGVLLLDWSRIGAAAAFFGGLALAQYAIQRGMTHLPSMIERSTARAAAGYVGALVLSVACVTVVTLYTGAQQAAAKPPLDVITLRLTMGHLHRKPIGATSPLTLEATIKNTSSQRIEPLTAEASLLDARGQEVLRTTGAVKGGGLAPGSLTTLRVAAQLPATALRVGQLVTTASPRSVRFVFRERNATKGVVEHRHSWGSSFILSTSSAGSYFSVTR
jgi:hypothetical protein